MRPADRPDPAGPSDPAGAAGEWRRHLGSWAIPDEILRAAPESPWGFPPALFARSAAAALEDRHPDPSRRLALEALPAGGVVLDVGAGGGAASLPLAPPAGKLIAVDESEAMLESFARAATERGVEHSEVAGRWPEAAPVTPVADVVVCHHVAYNVAGLAPFLGALTSHARRRVVVELTARHPQSDLNPLWLSIHGVTRPARPTAEDAAAVAAELGYEVHVERDRRPSLWDGAPREERIAFARRRLCVGPEHDGEIAAWIDGLDPETDLRDLVTLSWDGRA